MDVKVVLVIICVIHAFGSAYELKIGALIENPTNVSSGLIAHAAVDIAISKVNNDPSLLNGHKLKYVVGNSGCNGKQAIGEFARLIHHDKVDAIIGPSCNEGCLTSGYLATYHNLAMISHNCSTSKMSDRAKYPTFGRVRAYASASVAATAEALANFFAEMNWKRIGVIHSNDEAWKAVTDAIRTILERRQIDFVFDKEYHHLPFSATAAVSDLKDSGARSEFVICLFVH